MSLRICAHVVLHDLIFFTSAEPTCSSERPAVCVLACRFSFINLDF
ncbi:hypothetical protein CIT292_09963 [Citrobacter youngae ATCC 29220]|uniref:Uncharacterized protein n=1 Tax=Citrobacter youngae ATCC 29220 TaxID=500640 RepID=D4BHF1_9ENTR|nr:hypothetical protein CIT292_09963 [Citrobacter youngae ATCC 29220]